jgi:hypothetical protein
MPLLAKALLAAVVLAAASGDTIVGTSGDDRLRGGSGDDILAGHYGNDDMSGGDGRDSVTYADSARGVKVTIDDVADDGGPGESDNVQVDVEDVYGSPFDDVLIGSAADNMLDGGAGDDTLTGLGGEDDFFAGPGDDRVFSRDGFPDRVVCDEGFDSAIVDERDIVDGCEVVDRRPAVPRVDYTVQHRWTWSARETVPLTLRVQALAPRSARVRVRCSGAGCPHRLRTFRTVSGADVAPLLRGVRLRPGAVVELRAEAPDQIGRVVLFRVRRNQMPARADRCIGLGSRRLVTCPTTG